MTLRIARLTWIVGAAAIAATPAWAQEPATPIVKAAAPEKVKCRTKRVTGSLVRTSRVCMTEREWSLQRERAQQFHSLICSDRTACAGS
jgi:hypothetical protein